MSTQVEKKELFVKTIAKETLDSSKDKIKKIVFLADIHIENSQERDVEYFDVFKNLEKQLGKKGLDLNEKDSLAIVCGDVLDKYRIIGNTMDKVETFCKVFPCPIVFIVGNHESNMNNPELVDSLSPLIKRGYGKFKNYVLLQQGEYVYRNLVLTLTDMNAIKPYNPTKKIKGKTYIGLGHFTVKQACCNIEERMIDKIDINDFKGYDFIALGDIHRHQFLDKKETRFYPGSLIQRDWGEDPFGHGFVYLDLEKSKATFKKVLNKVGRIKLTIDKKGKSDYDYEKYKCFTDLYVQVINKSINMEHVEILRNKIKGDGFRIKSFISMADIKDMSGLSIKLGDKNISSFKTSKDVIDVMMNYIKENKNPEKKLLDKIRKRLTEIADKSEFNKIDKKEIKLLDLEFENIFGYEYGKIDFTKLKGKVCGLLGKNNGGKSSIISILYFSIYQECNKMIESGKVNNCFLVRNGQTQLKTKVNIMVNGEKYTIIKKGTLQNDGQKLGIKTTILDKDGFNISDKSAGEINNMIIDKFGDYSDIIQASSMNCGSTEFIDTKKKREYIINLARLDIFDKINNSINKLQGSLNTDKGSHNKILTKYSDYGDRNNILDNIKNKIDKLNKEIIENKKNLLIVENKKENLSKEIGSYEFEIKNLPSKKIKNIKKLKKELEVLNNEINNKRDLIEKLKEKMKDKKRIEREYGVFQIKNEQELIEIQDQINSLNREIIKVEFDEKKYEDVQNKLKKIKISKSRNIIKKEYNKLCEKEQEQNKLNSSVDELNKKIKIIKQDLKSVSSCEYDESCKYCMMNTLVKQKIYLEDNLKLNYDKLETLKKEIDKNEKWIKKNEFYKTEHKNLLLNDDYKLELENMKKNKKQCDENNRNEDKIKKLQSKIKEIKNRKDKDYELMKENSDKLNIIIEENNDLLNKKKEIEEDIENYSKFIKRQDIEKKLKSKQEEMEKHVKKISKNRELIEKLNVEQGKLESIDKIVKDAIKGLEDNDQERAEIKIINECLSENSLVDKLLKENIIPKLQNYINQNLKNAGFTELELKLDNGVLEIYDTDKIPKMLSGKFEKYLINILFKHALSKINISYVPTFLMIDESFDSGDDKGKDRIMKVMNIIKKDGIYDNILMITHSEQLKDVFDVELKINNNDGVRRIEYV